MLKVENLAYQRGERWLWQDLNFELAPGSLLQIMGANGSGKTSLLRILAGLAQATAGKVEWRSGAQLHYLGHQPAVKTELTVAENLRFNGPQTSESARHKALAKVGLTAQINDQGHQLSQGQKQRLALARLFLSSASLWILDEPMAGLDAEMIENFQNDLTEQLNQNGMVVLSTHWPLTAPAFKHSMRLNLK